MHKVNSRIINLNISYHILMQGNPTNRLQHQHCKEIQAEPSTISMGWNGRSVSFWWHTSCTTRFRNVNAWKTKQKENIWTKCYKSIVHSPMFKAPPNGQRHPTINRGRMNIRHFDVQAKCHINPRNHACRHNYGSSQAFG